MDFNEVLSQLTSLDNEVRAKAEKVYESISLYEKINLLFISICDDSKPDDVSTSTDKRPLLLLFLLNNKIVFRFANWLLSC